MTQLTRVVELEELDDLIRASRTAHLAYVEGGELQAIRVSGRHENGRWLVTLPPEVPPADGQRVVLLIDDGEYYFELRGSLRATMLALTGFAVSAALVAGAVVAGAAIGLLPGEWNWRYGLLIGVILGGSSSVVVMPAVLQLGLPERIANLVSADSALTDILCAVSATSLLAIMVATNGSEPDPAASLGVTFGVGLAAGAMAGWPACSPPAPFGRPSTPIRCCWRLSCSSTQSSTRAAAAGPWPC
jgi:hypothetical protein